MQLEINAENMNLGSEAFKRKDYQAAIRYFTATIQDNYWMDFWQAHMWRGISLFFTKKYEDAIEDLSRAALTPERGIAVGIENTIRIYNWRGLSYKMLHRYTEAQKDFEFALKAEQKFREAYVELYEIGFLVDDIDLSSKYFFALIEFDRLGINLFITRADSISQTGNFELAIKMCDFLLSKVKNEANSIQIRGTSHAQSLNYGFAMKDFNRFIELCPNEALGYYNRAVLYHELKDERANQDFKRAAELGMEIANRHII